MSRSNEIDPELLASFVDDALDSLFGFEKSALGLASPQFEEALQELFRSAHNLKGASMCIGLLRFGDFVHRVEDLIQSVIDGDVDRSDRVIAVLLAAHQAMARWVRELSNDSKFEPDVGSITQSLADIRKHVATAKLASQESDEEGTRGQVEDEAELEALFELHRKRYEEEHSVPPKSPSAQFEGEICKTEISGRDAPSIEPRSRSKLARRERQARPQESIRISAQKLDELIQLVSELSIHQAIVQEARKNESRLSRAWEHAFQLSQKITRDIHAKALELRMQPLSGLMQKLERTAVDLASDQGKRVRVVFDATDVQLDKSVIERISDSLVHMIRNSVDHGIEDPEKRAAAGKAPEAVLEITAVQESSEVRISISDDGKGMDDELIFTAAVKKGIVRPDEKLTSAEIKNLIFVQGISTAKKLTEISGRGVGMDVVMRTVQSLRGRIDIQSTLGKGTTFIVTLPTTLSIIDALVVNVHESRYAVPMQELTEIIDLSCYPVEKVGHGGLMISLRGQVVPVEALSDYMPTHESNGGSRSGGDYAPGRGAPALLVRDGSNVVAFAIDNIVSQQQVVVRPLSEQLEGLQGLRGCTILGDGEPGVILSLPDIARAYFSSVTQSGGSVI